jgi:hypothetical protein
VQHHFKKVEYNAYFGVDHQNTELIGDLARFQFKEQVHAVLQAHQCSILNMTPNFIEDSFVAIVGLN